MNITYIVFMYVIGKRKLKLINNIPWISTKRTITSRLKSLDTKRGPRRMMLEIYVPAWDRHKHVAGLNRLMGPQPFPLDTESPTVIHI